MLQIRVHGDHSSFLDANEHEPREMSLDNIPRFFLIFL
ncbi:hypothetical protein CES86_5409 [Brucella lupini]|uniref:Uncharacterized protein n=1 Tax=Brucella lupini TaxID=255457 RepID=A0A256H0B3_9HYPH|nr:hypothetical protein CES86_5409 [Brucella lupini]